MLKRTITGFFIALVTVAFFLLRILVDYRIFDILTYGMAIVGAYEITKAFSNKLTPLRKYLAIGFPIIVMPFVTFLPNYALQIALLYSAIIVLVIIFDNKAEEGDALSGMGLTLFSAYYPTVPLIALQLANALPNGVALMAILAVFLVAQLTDVFAYLVGSLLKGKKLIPSISPNKTVSGAIGGLLGGILGSVLAYFISVWCGEVPFKNAETFSIIIFLIFSGALLSIVNQVGDLVESYIKRKVGLKDMGNIFPGHGGMLDRVDGLSFVSLVTFVIYSFLV
ncbi:MAG: CDP-archaeol synthase [Clostridia bacterium]|nr:CDP-archaeol synthase [Clostridia bacterium]